MRVEGIGFDDVCARFEIGIMDLTDDFGLGQHEEIVVALEVAREIFEALAPVASLVQLVALDHGTHRAVEDEDALLCLALQRRGTLVSGHDATFASVNAFAGRRPKRWQMA